jgi:hypothetical protein
MSVTGTAAPDLGRVFPGWSLRAAFAVVAVGLCVAEATAGFWLGVSLLLAAAAVAVPRWLTAWFLIGVLAFTVLLREQTVADWRPYLLIAGAHLLHLLGSWMLVVAPTARVQPAALWPSARRFLLIEAPVQIVAAGALALTSAFSGASLLGLAVVAGAAVLALVVALAAPLLRRPRG